MLRNLRLCLALLVLTFSTVVTEAEAAEGPPPAVRVREPVLSSPVSPRRPPPIAEPMLESPADDASIDGLLPIQDDEPALKRSAPATSLDAADLPPELADLRAKLRQTLDIYATRRLNTRDHNPWEVIHGIIAFGTDTQVSRGGPGGEPINAIAWLCGGGHTKGQSFVYTEGDRVLVRKGPYVQGHHGQFLAILAQSFVPADYPLKSGGKTFTMADLIESEKLGCRPQTELTFKLISMAYYLDSDAQWKSDDGQDWSLSRLIHEEIAQPILRTAPCGGTHRLTGLAYAVRKRTNEGRPIDGEFLRAQKYLNDYHAYAFKLQNDDGSFSTEWFTGRGARQDLNRRLQTSGHILEWLAYSLPVEQLRDPATVRAVEYLHSILAAEPNRQWEIGTLGHGLHALSIYARRIGEPIGAAEIVADKR